MKKILLLMMLAFVSLGTWAQPSVSFNGSTATITNDGDDYLDLSSNQAGIAAFGAESWARIKECTTLTFVGKFGSLEGFSKNDYIDPVNYQSSVATTVDFKDALFPVEERQEWIYGDPNSPTGEYQPYQKTIYDYNMTFSYWNNTLVKAVTPKDPNAVVKKDMFNGNQDSKLEEVVFCGGTIESFSQDKPMPKLKRVSFPEETVTTTNAETGETTETVYGVSRIEKGAFRKLLKKVDNNQPTSIEMDELDLPGTLTHIGSGAFFECDAIETLEMRPLYGECTIGGDGGSEEEGVFAYCFSMKHATLSEGVLDIGKDMFKECVLLESVRIPTTAREIKAGSFNLCAGLHELIIPEYSGEGSQKIHSKVFENSGLTDIYVMATTVDKIPQIISLSASGDDQNSTFIKAQSISNTHDPATPAHREKIRNASDDEVISWYTAEMSDSRYGRGGGDCMVVLHYPDIQVLKNFYDGANNPLTGETPDSWLKNEGTIASVSNDNGNLRQNKIEEITEGGFISSGYAIGSETVDENGWTDYQVFGQSASGKYWPTRIDYDICLMSGATATQGVFSSLGWRQLPIKQTTNNDDYIFTKEYDNTWYTMCFPWDMDDNTLFRAFNQKCEIAEFVGVEMIKDEENSTEEELLYNLVFHFDRVAPTSYVTENRLSDGRLYVRTEDGDVNNPYNNHAAKRSVPVGNKGATINFYTYKCIESKVSAEIGQYIYMPYGYETTKVKDIENDDDRAMVETYASITHLIAKAGHPYMIHPAIGARTGYPADCTIAGVKKLNFGTVDPDNKIYFESAEALAEANRVEFKATTGAVYNSWETEGEDQKQAEFINPQNKFEDGTGSYVFIGNPSENPQNMLTDDYPIAYYLGAEADQPGSTADPTKSYPKYYRKKGEGKGQGKWSPYTAIIRPLESAQKNIECYVPDSPSGTNRNVVFGDWEQIDADAIQEIISEAISNNQSVKKAQLNVVFSVNGQVVRTDSNSVEGLPSGLYIVNGKKYMVK